jgi:anti-sigma B factor antagonist
MGESEEPLTRHSVTDAGDGSFVVTLAGELDLSTTDELRDAVAETVAAVTDTLIVDIAELRFADSSAIALWVSWSQRVPRLEIRNPPPMILRVIQAMGLTKKLNPS